MFMMDPSAVPEPAAYSTPPSPRSNAAMDDDQVKEVVALVRFIDDEQNGRS